jgi:hypothetical protein
VHASNADVRARQAPIRQRCLDNPDGAVEVLSVHGGVSDLADPLHVVVSLDSSPDILLRSGAHPAVGGEGDVPCSGDLLLAALAACQDGGTVADPCPACGQSPCVCPADVYRRGVGGDRG